MAYLNDYLLGNPLDKSVARYSYDSTTYPVYYRYWTNLLYDKILRLFKWNISEDKVLPKEIENRLALSGHCVIAKLRGELTAFWNSFFGVTKYGDEWQNVTIRCPIYAGSRTLGKDAVLINNTQTRQPLIHVVVHYAQLLAHNDVTIVNALVNMRDSKGVPTVSTERQRQSMQAYHNQLYKGKHDVVTDIANLGVTFIGEGGQDVHVKELFEARSQMVKAFYAEIGIRTAFEKGNNAVDAEVTSDSMQLKFALEEMLEERQAGAERVNDLFGTSWTVELAKSVDVERAEQEELKRMQAQAERGDNDGKNDSE